MEQLSISVSTSKEVIFQTRNSEEALLVALNACARVTLSISEIIHPTASAFGEWIKRIQGQRGGSVSIVDKCLSFLCLKGITLHIGDFFVANFQCSDLRGVEAYYTCFIASNFTNANLEGAILVGSNFNRAILQEVKLVRANLASAPPRV